MTQYPTDLTEKQWQVIKNILEPQAMNRKHSLKEIIREFGIILKQNQLFCMFNGISLQCFGLIVIKAICCQRCNQIH